MISDETARLLAFIADSESGIPEDQLPNWVNWRDPDDLARRGFVYFSTVVPPNKEAEYPMGLRAVRITTSGRDALAEKQRTDDIVRNQAAQYEEEKRAHSREKKMDFIRDLILLFIGAALTLIVEHVILP